MSRNESPIVPAPPDPATPIGPETFARLSYRQQCCLADIAFVGDGTGWHPRTLESLAARGLIEPYRSEIPGRRDGATAIDRVAFVVTKYRMSFHVHIHFCEWLETLPDDYFGEEAG